MTPFYKWLDRQVISNPASTYDPSAPRYTNEGTGRVYGVETLVRATLGSFGGFLAYTWQRSLRTEPGGPEVPFDFDQSSLLTSVYDARFAAEDFGVAGRCRDRDVSEIDALLRSHVATEVTLVES